MYINGIYNTAYSDTSTYAYGGTNSAKIGAIYTGVSQTQRLYISNLRIVKDIAIYTGNFKVPIAQLSADMTRYTTTAGYTGSIGNVPLLAFQAGSTITTNNGSGAVLSSVGSTNYLINESTRVITATYSSGGASGASSFVVSDATGILSGQIVLGTGIPTANGSVYVNNTYVPGSTTVNLVYISSDIAESNALLTAQAAGTYYFYNTLPQVYSFGTKAVTTY
jgi:hypothetical protein